VDWDVDLDCAGLICPLPVLRARKRLLAMQPGQILRLTATDPMAAIDVPHFCAEAGHMFLGADKVDGTPIYLIRRGA
jgi:tRNA 2-thiouridine synthesizing protein A